VAVRDDDRRDDERYASMCWMKDLTKNPDERAAEYDGEPRYRSVELGSHLTV